MKTPAILYKLLRDLSDNKKIKSTITIDWKYCAHPRAELLAEKTSEVFLKTIGLLGTLLETLEFSEIVNEISDE